MWTDDGVPDGDAGEMAAPDPVCATCSAPAVAGCPRCGALYCDEHGRAVCDECAAPGSGVPSRPLFLTVLVVLVVGALASLVLLVYPPRLPGEHAPAATTLPAPAAAPAEQSAPETVPPAPATPPGRRYIIQQGDTLNAIAARLGVTAEQLRAANPGIDDAALQVGQSLVVP